MDATVELGEGASLTYTEGHYHGPNGGIQVRPKASVTVGKGARYFSDFSLLHGRVGRLAIEYAVAVEQGGVVEMNAKVFGHQRDDIRIRS